jgi:hypothetical protein
MANPQVVVGHLLLASDYLAVIRGSTWSVVKLLRRRSLVGMCTDKFPGPNHHQGRSVA